MNRETLRIPIKKNGRINLAIKEEEGRLVLIVERPKVPKPLYKITLGVWEKPELDKKVAIEKLVGSWKDVEDTEIEKIKKEFRNWFNSLDPGTDPDIRQDRVQDDNQRKKIKPPA